MIHTLSLSGTQVEDDVRRLNRKIYIHDEVSDQLERDHRDIAPRFAMLCRQLGVSEWIRFKPTKGENDGWRRSPLGGTGGSHYYMWWLAAGAGPGKALALEGQDIAIRAIRHHDLTDKRLLHGDLDDYWEFSFVEELDDEQVLEQPWTEDQQSYISQREDCQVLIGPPGSGKTSSLWRALEVALLESRTLSNRQDKCRALYITWSQRLAESAEQYFSIMAPHEVEVFDLTGLFSRALSKDLTRIGLKGSRLSLLSAIERLTKKYNLKKRALARPHRFYDLIRAWVIGRGPWSGKRVGNSKVDNEQERLIQEEFDEALALFEALDLDRCSLDRLFPELSAAEQVLELHALEGRVGEGYQFVVIDEVQDLTPLELAGALKIAKSWSTDQPRLYLAGDEGQVVRPTFFEFSELNDQLFAQGYHPQSTTLASNLRSPKVIADSVIRAKSFNGLLPAKYRPADQAVRPSDYETEALLALSYFDDQRDLIRLVETLSANPNVYFIELYEDSERLEADLGIHGQLTQVFNTAEAVKGLEFASVCIVGASALIDALDPYRAQQDPLAFRLDVNRLRVAMSRAVEHLIFIEPRHKVRDELRTLIGGRAGGDDWERASASIESFDLREGCVISLSALEELLSSRDLSVEERVQGFISRAERLFFDELRADEAYEDLATAMELAERTGEISEELFSALRQLLARVALTETLRKPTQRLLQESQIMGVLLRDAVRAVGGDSLLELMSAAKLWSEDAAELRDLRRIFHSLTNPHVIQISWLTHLFSETKYALFEKLHQIASLTETALTEVDVVLEVMGFSTQEQRRLSLSFRRDAFDTLIENQWSDAEAMWQGVESDDVEDLWREAQLHEARQEWVEAAELYERLNSPDYALKAYREAGEIERAVGLLEGRSFEELESWSMSGLELLSVTTRYVRRYPLSTAERATLFRYGDEEIKRLRDDLLEDQSSLRDRQLAISVEADVLKEERALLEREIERVQGERDRLEMRESALKRNDRRLKRNQPLTSALLDVEAEVTASELLKTGSESSSTGSESSADERAGDLAWTAGSTEKDLLGHGEDHGEDHGSTSYAETMDALPAIGFSSALEGTFAVRIKRLTDRASALSMRELELRRVGNQLRLDQEKLEAGRRALQRRQAEHEEESLSISEQRQGIEVRLSAMNQREERLKGERGELSERQRNLVERANLLDDRDRALILELETLHSETERAQRAQAQADEASRKRIALEEELRQREERLERRIEDIERRERELEQREESVEVYGQSLSGFHPALIKDRRDQPLDQQEEISQEESSSYIPSIPQGDLEEDVDDWSPRYTSTAIQVFTADLVHHELEEDIEVNDTELEIPAFKDEEHIPLPRWFEQSTAYQRQAGDEVVDDIEGVRFALKYCPAGSFLMGSAQGEPAEHPQHEVQLTAPLLMAESLITQRLWAMVMGQSPSRFVDPDRPVERVSWIDAALFCNRLSALGGLTPVYHMAPGHHEQIIYRANFSASGYRLPTEAEWEYIARAGTDNLFAGSQRAADVAWSSRSARGSTQPVMMKAPNAWGIYDLCGNVAEWCADISTSYEHRPRVIIDPLFDASQGDRVIRGGAWSCSAYLCRVTSRGSAPAHSRGPDIGVRVCRRMS